MSASDKPRPSSSTSWASIAAATMSSGSSSSSLSATSDLDIKAEKLARGPSQHPRKGRTGRARGWLKSWLPRGRQSATIDASPSKPSKAAHQGSRAPVPVCNPESCEAARPINAIDPEHYRQVALDAVKPSYPDLPPADLVNIGEAGHYIADKSSRHPAQEAPAVALAYARRWVEHHYTMYHGIWIMDPIKGEQLFLHTGALAVAVFAVARAIGSYFWGEGVIVGTHVEYQLPRDSMASLMKTYGRVCKEHTARPMQHGS